MPPGKEFHDLRLPTAALSASGKRVEACYTSSQPVARAPLCLIVTVFYTSFPKNARGKGTIWNAQSNAERIFNH